MKRPPCRHGSLYSLDGHRRPRLHRHHRVALASSSFKHPSLTGLTTLTAGMVKVVTTVSMVIPVRMLGGRVCQKVQERLHCRGDGPALRHYPEIGFLLGRLHPLRLTITSIMCRSHLSLGSAIADFPCFQFLIAPSTHSKNSLRS